MLFWEHLLHHQFLQFALIGGFLASIACGVIGSFVVVQRATYVAGAISHCVLGGMGAAHYLHRVHEITWLTPLIGATFSAILAALIISAISIWGNQRQDTILSAIWAVGMAVGISFITATPGYYEDLMSYLFGNILMIGKTDIIHMILLDVFILLVILLFYNKFLVVSFQPQLARLRGVRVELYQTLLLILISLTVVLLTQVVGLILVIALITLPAATSLQFSNRLWTAMILATFLCFGFISSGIAISYVPELPAGATIIQVAGTTFLLVMLAKWLLTLKSKKQAIKNFEN
ncbi:metal ABC transporter permease [Psychrobacter sp. HD31]|uniref:metal ABC transporter permease n=1 Tax=Psychrobacter sp. HD31 TaxID=3112003 RepID=UPI003DA5C6C5